MKTTIIVCLLFFGIASANAQILTNTWTLAGGGLDPQTYGNNYRPPTLVSDAGSTGTATIAMSGLTSGGLGSDGAGAYGGIYTFFSAGLALNLQVTNLLAGIDQVTFQFLAGGGSPALTYSQNSLTLNYNAGNPAVASSGFSAESGIIVPSPIGDQNLTAYTWSWANLSTLGSSSAFSIGWNAPQSHVFVTDMMVTQAVPEPSVFALAAFGIFAVVLWQRRRTNPKLG